MIKIDSLNESFSQCYSCIFMWFYNFRTICVFCVRAIFRHAQTLWKISKHRKIYMKIISISFVRQMHIAVQFYEANMLIALCSESAVDLVLRRVRLFMNILPITWRNVSAQLFTLLQLMTNAKFIISDKRDIRANNYNFYFSK